MTNECGFLKALNTTASLSPVTASDGNSVVLILDTGLLFLPTGMKKGVRKRFGLLLTFCLTTAGLSPMSGTVSELIF